MGNEHEQEHTHYGLSLYDKFLSKNMVLKHFKKLFPETEPQVDIHREFNTILGYHYGMGDKPKCQTLHIDYPANFNIEKYFSNIKSHKSNGK